MNTRKDDLTIDLKAAIAKNEEWITQVKANKEIEKKRLLTALNRQKSEDYKVLLANDEMIKQTNADLSQKLTEVKTNFNEE